MDPTLATTIGAAFDTTEAQELVAAIAGPFVLLVAAVAGVYLMGRFIKRSMT